MAASNYGAPTFPYTFARRTAPYTTTTRMVTYEQLDTDEFEYVTRKFRGRVYIINNYLFKDPYPDRNFSGLDLDSMMAALKYVGFKDPHIDIKNNLTSTEMRALVEEAAQQSYLEYSCLFIIVLTHGDSDRLYGVDGVAMAYEYLIQPIRAASKGHGCLNGIPKVLLVQACDSSQANIQHPYTLLVPKPPQPPLPLEHDAAVFGPGSPQDTAPNSDMIIAYSTLPGTEGGSRFIQAFAQVMRRDGKRLDVAIMFARASRLITYLPGTTKLNKSLPSANVISQLKKNVYFS